ncbi:hypothetical protein OAG75_01165 [bacterium]|nr:hypothetical protein [bacterium]
MTVFQWIMSAAVTLFFIGGGMTWLAYVSVTLGKMVTELKSLNEKFGGMLDWVKRLDEKVDNHDSRIQKLESQCEVKQAKL